MIFYLELAERLFKILNKKIFIIAKESAAKNMMTQKNNILYLMTIEVLLAISIILLF